MGQEEPRKWIKEKREGEKKREDAHPFIQQLVSCIAASPSDSREEKRDFANWGLGRDGTRTGLSKKAWTWWKRHLRLIRRTGTRKMTGA